MSDSPQPPMSSAGPKFSPLLAKLKFTSDKSLRTHTWRDLLAALDDETAERRARPSRDAGLGREFAEILSECYDGPESGQVPGLMWQLEVSDDGCFRVLRPYCPMQPGIAAYVPFFAGAARDLPEADQALLKLLQSWFYTQQTDYTVSLPDDACSKALAALASLNRIFIGFDADSRPLPLALATEPSLEFRYHLSFLLPTGEGMGAENPESSAASNQALRLWGEFLHSGGAVIDLWDQATLAPGGCLIHQQKLFTYRPIPAFALIAKLQLSGALHIPSEDIGACLFELMSRFSCQQFVCPDDLVLHFQKANPEPVLYLQSKTGRWEQTAPGKRFAPLYGSVAFRYDSREYPGLAKGSANSLPVSWSETKDPGGTLHLTYRLRDAAAEETLVRAVSSRQGVRLTLDRSSMQFDTARLLDTIYALLAEGFEVWAEKARIVVLQDLKMSIESGTDWFGLRFAAEQKKLDTWQLIHVLKRKSLFLQLGDGQLCVLPEAWYRRLCEVMGFGDAGDNGSWRFSAVHALTLDRLGGELGSDKQVASDERFRTTVEKLRDLKGLTPQPAPADFQAPLRAYQEYGLAWLNLLDDMGFSGCLADEMGLGKTVQLLAFFSDQKAKGRLPAASLLVAPKSIVRQWETEARRLAPSLKVAMVGRHDIPSIPALADTHDLLIASYGFARRHSKFLATVRFHYVVLDEAQVVKNMDTQVSKAVRELVSERRLAITGTPIENHAFELLAIFSFLQPALCSAEVFSDTSAATNDVKVIEKLVQSLKPFILRRLKQDVLADLPEKFETTVRLSMQPKQLDIYENLRSHYLRQCQFEEERGPLEDYKLVFLEGLLRLRQAACHGGLIANQGLRDDIGLSNKTAYLLERVLPLVEGGHKIVIFSQFVKLLHLVRDALTKAGVTFGYFDGQTQNRQEVVAAFQEERSIPVLLVSLHAGGVGLNLTAADYCFMLDPWWNPAVENQAVDRLHRIGQTRKVFIYRLISSDSVEEKILELQERKKKHAELIGTTDQAFLENLSYEDFRILFGDSENLGD